MQIKPMKEGERFYFHRKNGKVERYRVIKVERGNPPVLPAIIGRHSI